MSSIEDLLLKLEERFILGEISEPVYLELKAKYEKMANTGNPEPASGVTPGDAGMIKNSTGAEFVLISPGTFIMGSPIGERGHSDDETQHQVTLSKAFYLQTTPVTQGQWRKVMGNNPSSFKNCGNDCPVENVCWDDVQEFIAKLNWMEGIKQYRLPTESEWEYASRAGSSSAFCFGDNEYQLEKYGWYDDISRNETHPVGQKKPNAWGLYDMHGNVMEWVQDWYGDYPSGGVTDPKGPAEGTRRVYRGGGWDDDAWSCRSAFRSSLARDGRFDNLGFRLARTL